MGDTESKEKQGNKTKKRTKKWKYKVSKEDIILNYG